MKIAIAKVRLSPAKYILLGLSVAAAFLIAFAFYTGEPVFFLKWLLGLQADD
jgi:hypothetical protein